MKRCVVCVATTPYYQRGQMRLQKSLDLYGAGASHLFYRELPANWPTHQDRPYAFKAYALNHAASLGFDTVLWADACMLPVKCLGPLWDRIERDGYWMSRSGYSNYEWTVDSAYPDLFPEWYTANGPDEPGGIEAARLANRKIEHVAATCFGLNLRHETGRKFLEKYYRLASETRAFCGPWNNSGLVGSPNADVRGHRHDQTAASVIAWRLGMELTSAPDIFAYPPGDPEKTILLADGSYT